MYTAYAVITLVALITMFIGILLTFLAVVIHRGPVRARWGVVIFVVSLLVFLAFMIAASDMTRPTSASDLLLGAVYLG